MFPLFKHTNCAMWKFWSDAWFTSLQLQTSIFTFAVNTCVMDTSLPYSFQRGAHSNECCKWVPNIDDLPRAEHFAIMFSVFDIECSVWWGCGSAFESANVFSFFMFGKASPHTPPPHSWRHFCKTFKQDDANTQLAFFHTYTLIWTKPQSFA